MSSFNKQSVFQFFTPFKFSIEPSSDVSQVLQQARESILDAMMRTVMVLGAVIYVVAVFGIGVTPGVLAAYTGLLFFAFYLAFSKRLGFERKVTLGIIMFLTLSLVELFNFGISDDSRLYFLTFCLFVLIFRGTVAGVVAFLFSATTLYLTGLAIIRGRWSVPNSFYDHAGLAHAELVALVSDWTFVAVFLTVSVTTILRALQGAWKSERESLHQMQQQSEALAASLEREREALKTMQQQSEALGASLQRETQLAQALSVSLDKERELNDMRSRIITTISHEFRTPLTIIKNSLSLLDKYSDRLTLEKRQRYFSHVCMSVEHLCTLIEDVETVGTRDTMINMVIPERMPMSDLYQSLCQHLITQSKSPDRIQINPLGVSASREIFTDKIAIYNVLHQLVDNALKYSAAEIYLTFHVKATQLQIDVCDSGIGIAAKEQTRIFDLLERGTNAETITGLGIGLYVAKQVASMLDGSLSLRSAGLGQGSCFTLSVPLEATSGITTGTLQLSA